MIMLFPSFNFTGGKDRMKFGSTTFIVDKLFYHKGHQVIIQSLQ